MRAGPAVVTHPPPHVGCSRWSGPRHCPLRTGELLGGQCRQEVNVAAAHSAPRGLCWVLDALSLPLRPNPGPSISSDLHHVSLCPWIPILAPIGSQSPLLDPSDPQTPILDPLNLRPHSWTPLTPILGTTDPQPPSLNPRSRPLCPAHLLRALHISMVTSTDKAMVVGKRDSNTSHSVPAKSGLSSEHFRKFL